MRTRLLLLIYVVLLVLSNGWRLLQPVVGTPSAEQTIVNVTEYDSGQPTDKSVRIAYHDQGDANATPILLIHGTPVASAAVLPLAREFDARFRVVTPDLPGFGGSTLRVADYSIQAHAIYLRDLLDHLNLDSVHVVGYSRGGGVALSLADLAPERVRSLSLASSIGVQELELLGDYHLNHALYAVQLGLFKAAEWFIPHFGYLDDAIMNVAYARNVYDSDQRPLRAVLERLNAPTLILQGREDGFVRFAAALEHHRIAPHSELALFDGGHMLAFTEPALFGNAILDFLERAESGAAATRDDALGVRLGEAEVTFDWSQVPPFEGMTLVIILCLLALATYVSEDLACITAGLMVARGMLEFVPATSACLVGIYTGDLLLFLAGKFAGPPALDRAPLKWMVDPGKLKRSREWFQRRGPAVIFVSRFIPGTRLPTYLVAGLLNMSMFRFSLYFLMAAVVWTPLLVGSATLIGAGVFNALASYQRYSVPIALALVAVLWLAVKIVIPLFSYRGRRLLLSSWRRKTRWEFWPMWAFYPPLLLYIIYLGIRYRSLTLFTASNPAIPASGFVGESKYAILGGLASADVVARYTLLRPESHDAWIEQVATFMRMNELDYPIVLKPDVGERGEGVLIARDASAVSHYLETVQHPLIVQAFAPGQEFGVFYYRLPTEKRGRIFAVTDKRPVAVTGDGQRTLEELILADDRAVCMAPTFLDRHAERLFSVPAPGEAVELVDVGTHSMGCLFLDGGWVVTPALEAEIDRISNTFDGFFFGRYDIRTPDVEDFQRGQNYKVVELNGVTSEATNIYDPRHSLLQAYRILLEQWRIAFLIGAANRARGVQPVSVRQLMKMVASAQSNARN